LPQPAQIEEESQSKNAEVIPNQPTESYIQTIQKKEIFDVIRNALQGTTEFNNQLNSVSYFDKSIELGKNNSEWHQVRITDYQLNDSNNSFQSGYEGSSWTIDLDEAVQIFSEFQKETQVVKVFDTVGNNQVAEVTPVQIGSKNGSNTIPTLNQREAGSDIT